MNEVRRFIFFIFVVNGAGYLVFVDQHYNAAGWYVWIKYIILAASFLFLTISFLAAKKIYFKREVAVTFFLWASIFSIPVLFGADAFRSFQYIVPIFSLVLFADWRHSMTGKYWWLIFCLTILGALFEYYWLGGFERFHPTGYRGVSIFVNPNNFGISIVILSAVAILKNYANKCLILVVTFFLVIYSGSKTALIMLIVLFICTLNVKVVTKSLFFIVSPILIISGFIFGGSIGYSLLESSELTSFFIRMSYASDFFSGVQNLMMPSVDSTSYYVDNAYLQLWIDLGFISAISLVFFMAHCFYCFFWRPSQLIFFI